jgi:aldose 1-epimerase
VSVPAASEIVELAAGDLTASVAPGAGMLVSSLRHRGEELLAERADVETYARTGLWTGSPLLYPWANRVSARRFAVGGRTVDASGARPDDSGTPMHGLPAARRGWTVEHADAEGVAARLDWDDAAFPFPHTVRVEHRLDGDGLHTTTEVSGDAPVAFGWHPFLQLPGEPRERWRITLGSRTRLELDDRKLPTGAVSPWAPETFALGEDDYDEAIGDIAGPFVLEGERRRIEVTFDEGAPYGQFFAPRIEPIASFEPMAAPGDALVTGNDLPWAPWRMRFTIRAHGA